jgi:hypothetical protein
VNQNPDIASERKVCQDNCDWLDSELSKTCLDASKGYAHADLRAASLQLRLHNEQWRLERLERAMTHEGDDSD